MMTGYRAIRESVLQAHLELKLNYIAMNMHYGYTEQEAEKKWEKHHKKLMEWVNELLVPDYP